jgi:hypothetical protein
MGLTVTKFPSSLTGLGLALRLRKLVGAVWLVSLGVFLPAHLVIQRAAGAVRANLPNRELPDGEEMLLMAEQIRPVAGPFVLALLSGAIALLAWSVLWHAGTVRWSLGAGAARVRLAEILGHGAVWWWRYARLMLMEIVATLAALMAMWIPVIAITGATLTVGSAKRAGIVLATGFALSLFVIVICRMAALRAAWLLGEPGRHSAVVAWLHGLIDSLRRPLRSAGPLVVWAVPGIGLLVLPLAVEGRLATIVLLLAWLGSAFCWVALYLSYAPPEAAADLRRKSPHRPPAARPPAHR